MKDVDERQSLAKEIAGEDEPSLAAGVPMLTGENDYHPWWQALRRNLQAERSITYWDALSLAINDGMNLMSDDEIEALSSQERNQHIVAKAIYILLLRRVVTAIRDTISPALNEASRGVGNQPFVLIWWIQSRFDECQPEHMAFMPELIRDLKIQNGPQQRVLDISDAYRGWDDWNGFDMGDIGVTSYIQLIGNEKKAES